MNSEVHICPILMRTVIWEDGKCTEECDESGCPVGVALERASSGHQS